MTRSMFNLKWQELSDNKTLVVVKKDGLCTQHTFYNTFKCVAKRIREELKTE